MFSNTLMQSVINHTTENIFPNVRVTKFQVTLAEKCHWRDNLEPRNAILTIEHDRKQMTLHKVKEYTLVNY